jgi:hypothetical protein
MFSLPAPSMFSLTVLSSSGATGKPFINLWLASSRRQAGCGLAVDAEDKGGTPCLFSVPRLGEPDGPLLRFRF